MNEAVILDILLSKVSLAEAPRVITLAEGHKMATVGIGKDHVAYVIIDDDAYAKLVSLTTEFVEVE